MSGAFINHRGIDSDSYSYVALLSYALCAGLPTEHVFLDSESIPPGADLVEALLRRLRGCDVLLTLIGLDRLAASDEVGRRIIDAPVDWIHRELVVVNRAGVRVIPVLTDGAEVPREADLPAEIAWLNWRQYRHLRYRESRTDLARISDDVLHATGRGNAAPMRLVRATVPTKPPPGCPAELTQWKRHPVDIDHESQRLPQRRPWNHPRVGTRRTNVSDPDLSAIRLYDTDRSSGPTNPVRREPLTDGTREAYEVCHTYAQSQTHGYGIGVRWLPHDRRPYCDALLAFVMHTDTLADDMEAPHQLRKTRFRDWREVFDAVQDGRCRGGLEWSICQAFVDTMAVWGLSQQSVVTYLDAQEEEVGFRHFATYAELRQHADELIGTTCAWANRIYGGVAPEAERRSRQLAMASQLSDYLVDLRSDLTRGRLYLPLEDLDIFGVSRRHLEQSALIGETPDQIRKLILLEAARAREFCDAGSGWELLVDSSARDAAWLPGAVYRYQLDQIERSGGDIFGVPPTSVEELSDRIRAKLTPPAMNGKSHTSPSSDLDEEKVEVVPNRTALPAHLGIILDGNRRWARKQGVPVDFGHRRGGEVFRELCMKLLARGIKYLSVYLFSTENWARDPREVDEIMSTITDFADGITDLLCAENARMRFLGRPHELPEALRSKISHAEKLTAMNTGATLAICVNYGGLTEIADAFRGMLAAGIAEHDVTPRAIAGYLYEPDIPPLDLVLRTGGERRLSNFMLWRAAYAEFAFIAKLWPEVTIGDIEDVLKDYAARTRRFGN